MDAEFSWIRCEIWRPASGIYTGSAPPPTRCGQAILASGTENGSHEAEACGLTMRVFSEQPTFSKRPSGDIVDARPRPHFFKRVLCGRRRQNVDRDRRAAPSSSSWRCEAACEAPIDGWSGGTIRSELEATWHIALPYPNWPYQFNCNWQGFYYLG